MPDRFPAGRHLTSGDVRRFLDAVAVVSLLALVSCGDGARRDELTVFAAASLSDVFGELGAAFEAANPGVDVRLSFAASSSLQEQILAGAPADVFAAASSSTMDAVVESGEVDGRPDVFARNVPALAVPEGNPAGVERLDDLADGSLLVGLCTEGVPCGRLARQLLERRGIVPAIDTNEPDVRSLLTKIAAGELDVGLVYATDVRAAADQVDQIEIPDADVVTSYPIARLASAPNPRAAVDFVELVLSPAGRQILSEHAFAAP